MSIAGSKASKAESVVSTKSRSGIAPDKHCYAININANIKCEGKKFTGKNWS
jgi:hypothetical protein